MLTSNTPAELELACLQALQTNDYPTAFWFADRRCRIQPKAQSYHHVLRADALYMLGYHHLAIGAVRRALELDPSDHQANRRMARWASGYMQIEAAERLLESRADWAAYVDAIACLKAAGRSEIAKLDVLFDRICGWVAWSTDDVVDLTIEGFAKHVLIPHPEHPLANGAYPFIANFDLSRPSLTDLELRLSVGGRPFYETRRSVARLTECAALTAPRKSSTVIPDPILTVIVPVYGDFDATRACLLSLKTELETSPGCCAIVIDDASVDPRMQNLLQTFAAISSALVLRNSSNLGFARSVNRGLHYAPSGDVLLLNADTLLPPDCLHRLIHVAQLSDDIATITPLSNNGELTSFPIANRLNPFPDIAELRRIDSAAQSNIDLTVDLPNGTGFCLYVTRRCLDAVGSLSERYGLGYYEDVDYCLRARELGLRNICAPSIYVGHHGSRSFGTTKRALVVSNLALLEQRFPTYQKECAAFLIADPLKEARSRIERVLLNNRSFDRLVIAPDSRRTTAHMRARWLIERGLSVLLVQVARSGSASLVDLSGSVPQNIEISFGGSNGFEADFALLSEIRFVRLEVFAPSSLPDQAICFIESQTAPVDMILEQESLMRLGAETKSVRSTSFRLRGDRLSRLAGQVEDYVAICPDANRYANLNAEMRAARYEPFYKTRRPRRKTGKDFGLCGILFDQSTVANYRLVLALARALPPDTATGLVYFGTSANDRELMATGHVFSSGVVENSELPEMIKCYGVDRIFMLDRQLRFGSHRLHLAKESGLPMAYFRWPYSMRPRKDDLALQPRLDDDDVVDSVIKWLRIGRS